MPREFFKVRQAQFSSQPQTSSDWISKTLEEIIGKFSRSFLSEQVFRFALLHKRYRNNLFFYLLSLFIFLTILSSFFFLIKFIVLILFFFLWIWQSIMVGGLIGWIFISLFWFHKQTTLSEIKVVLQLTTLHTANFLVSSMGSKTANTRLRPLQSPFIIR